MVVHGAGAVVDAGALAFRSDRLEGPLIVRLGIAQRATHPAQSAVGSAPRVALTKAENGTLERRKVRQSGHYLPNAQLWDKLSQKNACQPGRATGSGSDISKLRGLGFGRATTAWHSVLVLDRVVETPAVANSACAALKLFFSHPHLGTNNGGGQW